MTEAFRKRKLEHLVLLCFIVLIYTSQTFRLRFCLLFLHLHYALIFIFAMVFKTKGFTADVFDVQRDRVDVSRRAKKVWTLDEVRSNFVPLRCQSVFHGVK